MAKQYPKYAVPSVEGFIEMHKSVMEKLTEQEQRVMAKTSINLCLTWNEKPANAMVYIDGLNDLQRTTIKKFMIEARAQGKVNAFAEMACQRLNLI